MATSTDLNAAIDEIQKSMVQEEAAGDAQEGAAAEPADWTRALQDRLGALPWWVISLIVHAILLFLFVTFFTSTVLMNAAADDLFVTSEFVEPEEDKEVDMEKPRDLFKSLVDAPAEAEIEQPVLPHDDPDAEVSDHFETDNDMDLATARGDENALSTVPLGGTGVIGTIGVGGGGAAGVYGFRNGGGRKKCVMRYGGSKASESAVEAALKWLSDHQEADGSWRGDRNGDGSHGHVQNLGYGASVGLTGLATLAFLGAGYTHKTGKYRDTVDKAVTWLLSKQRADTGGVYIDPWHRPGGSYGHAIAGLALAEAYGMTKDEKLREAAQKAVDYSVNTMQQPYSGWRYFPRHGRKESVNEDLSVTGWYVMQLKSAKVAGLVVDGRGFQGAMNFVEKVTAKDGTAGYSSASATRPCMTAVGMVCRQFMGAQRDEAALIGGAKSLQKYLPSWEGNYAAGMPGGGDKGFYYWYYGTLGMFQQGGEAWKDWNGALRDMLIGKQCTARDGADLNGSWHPNPGERGNLMKGMRVFSTAVGALCLEVYYRYLPMYGQ